MGFWDTLGAFCGVKPSKRRAVVQYAPVATVADVQNACHDVLAARLKAIDADFEWRSVQNALAFIGTPTPSRVIAEAKRQEWTPCNLAVFIIRQIWREDMPPLAMPGVEGDARRPHIGGIVPQAPDTPGAEPESAPALPVDASPPEPAPAPAPTPYKPSGPDWNALRAAKVALGGKPVDKPAEPDAKDIRAWLEAGFVKMFGPGLEALAADFARDATSPDIMKQDYKGQPLGAHWAKAFLASKQGGSK